MAHKNQLGALLIVTAMAIIGLIDNFVLEIAEVAGLWQFHAVRAAMCLPALVLALVVTRTNPVPRNAVAVLARTLFLASAMVIYFAAIPNMPIALVVAGLFTSPCFVLIFSVLLFGVRVGVLRVAAVAVGFGGVLLILNPSEGLGWGFALPVLAGAFYALNVITTRHGCAKESTLVLLTAFFLAMGIIGTLGAVLSDGGLDAPFHARGWVPIGPELLFWCAVQAVGSLVGVFFLTRAYQIAEPSYLVVFEYTLLVFATFWAWLLYSQAVSGTAGFGIVLVVVAGVVITLRADRRRAPT